MAYGLVLEFEGADRSKYEAVNKTLGIDQATGKGNWPPGLISHAGGKSESGALVVLEVWKSKEDQERFMQSRLAAAVAGAGFTGAPKVTWVELFSYNTPDG
jgi:hypothetical protein